MSTLSQRLIADHDPEAELVRREAYLAERARTMPGLVTHQKELARGLELRDVLRTTHRPYVRRGPRCAVGCDTTSPTDLAAERGDHDH